MSGSARRRWIVALALLASIVLAAVLLRSIAPQARQASQPSVVNAAAWPPRLPQVPLWPGTPPDQPAAQPPAETSRTAVAPGKFANRPVTGVFDVSLPTMTVYPARWVSRKAAILVFPGGGFQQLAIDLEGTEACDWIVAHGVTCVLVKYRVPDSNHHYDARCRCAVTPPHLLALQDAQRAIRLVRARAAALDIDPHRIGVMGFSAGGYLVAQTSNIVAPAYRPVDALDRIDNRPDFAIALYPGHLCRAGGALDPGIHVTRQTPPTFLVQAWNDPVDPICNSTVYARALDLAGVPTELHLFARGGHAFALRPTGHPVDGWPALLERWLGEIGVLNP